MEELLSLKWNNHKLTFIHVLGLLRDKELYTDATLACEGNLYSVHKLVLSTCSDYFGDILEKIKCKNPVIVLKDMKHTDLEALLDYMYLGEVNVQQGDLASLIKAAECLRIKGLAESDGESPHMKSKSDNHRTDKTRDSSFTPPAKRNKRDTEYLSKSSQYNDSELFNSQHSGKSQPERSLTATPHTHKENITSCMNTDTSHHMFPKGIPKLEDATSTACSTIINLVDPLVKEEKNESDRDLDCYTLCDDSMFKDEEEINMVSSIDNGHNNIENSFPSLLHQVEGDMLQNKNYEQTSLLDSSVMQLDGGDDHDLSFSVPLSTAADEGLGESVVGVDRYGQIVSADRILGDGANAMSSRCLICNKVFTGAKTKFRLERHMFTHTGQRPYQCLMCDYRAGLKEHLTRHIKSQHALEK